VGLTAAHADRHAPAVAMKRRAAPFAAIIPGDSVVEAVVATGLYNFMCVPLRWRARLALRSAAEQSRGRIRPVAATRFDRR